MKKLIFILMIAAVAVSCKKRKEVEEWKKKEGNYNSSEYFTIYQSENLTLSFNQVNVNSGGFSLHSLLEETPGVNFDVYHKEYNTNETYQYKAKFSSLTGFQIASGGGLTNPQIPHDEFTAGREFYISFPTANKLVFTIIEQDGQITNLEFVKI